MTRRGREGAGDVLISISVVTWVELYIKISQVKYAGFVEFIICKIYLHIESL